MIEVEVQPAAASPQSVPVPGFLVELDSWPRVFFSNLHDLVFRRRLSLRLDSAPGAFWSDVFVQRRLPWRRFLESLAYHVLALAALVSFSRLSLLHPLPQPRHGFDHTQVISYEPVEYLPPVDTRRPETARPRTADPELSRQPIISLSPEADNRAQTIVAAPVVKLKRDVALPNILSWSDEDSSQRPQLAIAPPPVVLASSITRIAPEVSNSVVAPPPDLPTALRNATPQGPQPAIIEPPPEVERSSVRTLGTMNIGHAAVIAPAPQLSVSEQRAFSGASVAGATAQVVPPPPAWAASGHSAAGSRVIALSLHPAVGAPPAPPAGNRRGSFAATPEGHRGASGTPGGSGNANGEGSGNKERGKSDLPAGLYVGKATPAKTSSVAGDPAGKNASPANSVNPRLLASLSPPGANVPAHWAQPESVQPERAKLSQEERAVFGDRKFYSLTLNMPNLNSAGGSWVIRFAELNQDASTDSAGLSAPTATRKVDPAYPLQLMRENVEGTVIVYAVIHADGSVGKVRVLRGIDDRIDPFARQAISQWQFRPATRNGAPVDVEATFQIPFRSREKPAF
jgi:TonB family protein